MGECGRVGLVAQSPFSLGSRDSNAAGASAARVVVVRQRESSFKALKVSRVGQVDVRRSRINSKAVRIWAIGGAAEPALSRPKINGEGLERTSSLK